jgi:hypothetical protein
LSPELDDQQFGVVLLDQGFERPGLDLGALVDDRLVRIVPLTAAAGQLGLLHPIIRLRAADPIGMDDRALADQVVLQ